MLRALRKVRCQGISGRFYLLRCHHRLLVDLHTDSMISRRFKPVVQVEDTEEYQFVFANFRIAHEKVEEQRRQLEEQEQQIIQLRAHVLRLEGNSELQFTAGGNSIDDFSIKIAASQLDKLVNRWVSDIIQRPLVSLSKIYDACLSDVVSGPTPFSGTPMQVQSLLRHAIAECIAEGFINCLIVTNSKEANIQLSRIHEHIFARDPTVAAVWRRQTFSAAVETCSPDISLGIFSEHIPKITDLLGLPASSVVDSAFNLSRTLHGGGGSGDAFYRAFVPEVGSAMYASQIELVKRCLRNENGETDRVGCAMFPGIVKVGLDGANVVVRRAQVICECALSG
ncbi:hypothetical protein MIND_01198900 [Mycena indigotica]|uniref:Uncharacterized protein n=1 Tax=Mycena indigotica TaxID=2126181 RepID=A0A8H6VV16_9AGAR|nr:uncharacterized protein MIND_01198900 [Mycena indigotica]KAF7292996.1 hypothetical protein MIND_01198900 [Mycena indigotica]